MCRQGLLQLMESKVTVTVKSSDVQLAQEAAKQAESDFKSKAGKSTSVTVQEGLSKDCAGGVIWPALAARSPSTTRSTSVCVCSKTACSPKSDSTSLGPTRTESKLLSWFNLAHRSSVLTPILITLHRFNT